MSLLSVDEIKALVEQPQGVSVSLYMPTYRAGAETQQNAIRFKNLIKQAEAQLAAQGYNSTQVQELLQPALNLDKEEFWQTQDEGLAIFLAEGFLRYYCLPLKFEELVIVSERFHLKPLMPLLSTDGEFYILALSQQQLRFFEGSRYSVREVEIEGWPKSKDEALQYDETAKEGQFRISTSKGGTNNTFQHAGSFHGQGSPDQDDEKRDILQYFHLIDKKLHDFLRNKQAPLVLAGISYLIPIYKEANTYAHLMEEAIAENAEDLGAEALRDRVLSLIEPYFEQEREKAIEHYYELSNTGKTSTDPKEAIPAAYFGRVDQLFVPVGVQRWGSFDLEANALEMHSDHEPGDEDLLNAAAVQTLLNGGTVYAVEPEKVPDSAPLAAVFRY